MERDGYIERVVGHSALSEDFESNDSPTCELRPKSFDHYPGQERVVENLKIFVTAAKMRNSTLDHVLLHGPPGLGKTTLSKIIAYELGAPFSCTSGPSIEKPGDLAGILAGLAKGSILFIDEIHRLPIHVEEVLYSAMEDFQIDIIVGQGPTARSLRVPIAPFTLIGATTRMSRLSGPLLTRFGVQERLDFYSPESLETIINRSSSILSVKIETSGAKALASRARGTPRIANRLLRRIADFALVNHEKVIDESVVLEALNRLNIDRFGLDGTDRQILRTILERYDGGPVGIETLAVTIGEERSTIEDVYEPFLVYHGFVSRGPRGRMITESGKKALGSGYP